jgi:hypothetical protein
MNELAPLRHLPPTAGYKPGDVFVIFGELFSRGYANGIVDEAKRAGLKVIYSTVGRRDKDSGLRPLNSEELAAQPEPFINVPLEAGFDLEPCAQDGSTPVDQLAGIKLSEWENTKLDWAKIESSRSRGIERFKASVEKYMQALAPHISKGASVTFVHTMAGGVPRAKIIMPLMNRVFKGQGDRHLPSQSLWNSEIGKLASMSFDEVTAHTFKHLVDGSSALRAQVEKDGGSVRYVAYGYHGTEVWTGNAYKWQSYTPYIQGWAKMRLEDHARDAMKSGIRATVYNCPEILTNSSSIFQGVEIPLYPFMAALKREGQGVAAIEAVLQKITSLLKPEFSIASMLELTDKVLSSPLYQGHCDFATWPDHNSKEQMEAMLSASDQLISMHSDEKNLTTFVLSEEVFRATGYLMFHDSFAPHAPVLWLGHEVLAKALASGKTL